MNNRFKFRVWDKLHKEWIDDNTIAMCSDGIIIDIYTEEPEENYLAQFYTGCNDKNDTPIYEGDIINHKNKIGYVNMFAGMYLLEYNDQTDSGPIGFLLTNDMEIVGNIFDNNKLLNI